MKRQSKEQLKGVTMTTNDEGETVIPSRDILKALGNNEVV